MLTFLHLSKSLLSFKIGNFSRKNESKKKSGMRSTDNRETLRGSGKLINFTALTYIKHSINQYVVIMEVCPLNNEQIKCSKTDD